MDVTQTTVQSDKLENGSTALDKKGDLITGSATMGKIANLNWAQIKQCVNEGVDPSFLPIGTQVSDKWTWKGTTYDAPWNVVHYNSEGMYLQWEYATPEAIQFDAPEAMYYVGSNGLAAGQYYFSIGISQSQWTTARHINFTLTSACDPGDQFCINVSNSAADPTASRTITVYGYGSTTAKQTATTSDSTDGTELGTFGAGGTSNNLLYQTSGNCNGLYWIFYGNHRWSQSAIRQWLNSDAAAGEWWQPQNPWDRPPAYAVEIPGFLSGFSETFKNVLETTTVTTALDTVSGFTDEYEITQDKVFLPSMEQLYTVPEIGGIEGDPWDYWKKQANNSEINGYMEQDATIANNVRKRYKLNDKSVNSGAYLRSALLSGYGMRYLLTSGRAYNGAAYGAECCCPACVIKKTTPSYLVSSNLNWTTIKKIATLSSGTNLEVGSQIVDTWTASNNGTVWNVPWDVVHYDDTSMYLRWHYNLPFNTRFDAQEAMYYVGENGLAAGTYYITTSSATGNTNWNSKNIQFTLTSACDPGDQFVISSPTSDPTASRTLTVYGFGETTAKQTATTSGGTNGTLLGTMGDKGATNGNCNGVYWVVYGNHRWSQSNLRIWLNSDSAAGQWFTPMNPWDRPPSYVTYPGFLYGFSSDFKNALTYSENKTLLDTISGFTETYEITLDKIFLPAREQINYTPDVYDVEGKPWQYYQQLAENAGITGYFTAKSEALKIFNLDATTTAGISRLRSPGRAGNGAYSVSTLGSVASYDAYSDYKACPACKINLIK